MLEVCTVINGMEKCRRNDYLLPLPRQSGHPEVVACYATGLCDIWHKVMWCLKIYRLKKLEEKTEVIQ